MREKLRVLTSRQRAGRRAIVATWVALSALASSGTAQPVSSPDAHDRAAVAVLAGKVAIFRDIESAAFGASISRDFRACVPLEESIAASRRSVGAAFSALLSSGFDLSVPLTIDLADRDLSQLTTLRGVLGGVRADSPLFARWLVSEGRSVDLILAFANGGRPVNACRAATYFQGLTRIPASGMASALALFPGEVGISLARYRAIAPRVLRLQPRRHPRRARSGNGVVLRGGRAHLRRGDRARQLGVRRAGRPVPPLRRHRTRAAVGRCGPKEDPGSSRRPADGSRPGRSTRRSSPAATTAASARAARSAQLRGLWRSVSGAWRLLQAG